MATATFADIILNLILPKESPTLAVEATADFGGQAAVEAAQER